VFFVFSKCNLHGGHDAALLQKEEILASLCHQLLQLFDLSKAPSLAKVPIKAKVTCLRVESSKRRNG